MGSFKTIFFCNDNIAATHIFSHRINVSNIYCLICKVIGKVFDRKYKKTDLSDISKTEKVPKRQREQSPNLSCLKNPISPGDNFFS